MRLLFNAFLVILGGCSFGILAPIVKRGTLYGIEIADSTRMQLFFGFVLLAIINGLFVKYRMQRKTIIKLILSGLPMGLTTTFLYKSLQYLEASIAIVLLFQYIWFGIISEWLMTKRKPTKEKIIATIIILLGSIFAMNLFEANLNHLPLLGIIWGLLAAISFATFLFVSGQVATHVPPLRKSMLMTLGGLIIIFLIYPPTDLSMTQINYTFIRQGLLLGILGGVLPPLLFSRSMPVVGHALGTILSSSELPTTVIFSAILLAERISVAQVIGISLIIAAIIFVHAPYIKNLRQHAS